MREGCRNPGRCNDRLCRFFMPCNDDNMNLTNFLLTLALLYPALSFSQVTSQESKDPFRRLNNAETIYDVSIKFIAQEVLAVEN